MFKKVALLLAILTIIPVLISWLTPIQPAYAQTASSRTNPTATNSAIATTEGQLASSPSAEVVQQIEEKKEKDITETTPQIKSRLARFLQEHPVQPLGPTNFVQHAIRQAVNQGVPANVLVLILMFPVIASFIAISRHIIGLQGFGVYTPAILAVALLSTGILTGLLLFTTILIAAMIGHRIFRKFRLQYLPRTALMLWLVSIAVFIILIISPYLVQFDINIITVSIFPILVLMLLSENFLEAQLSGSQFRAIELTLETILLAVLSAILLDTESLQRFVIIYPEITIIFVFVSDLAIGRFTGLRLSEYLRFRPIMDPEE